MPKCADVQLQLGSDNLLEDIKDVAFFRKLQRLGLYTFGKAHDNAMKHGGFPEIDAWICPSAILARPLEAHERRHMHPEFDVWIEVDTVRREILAGTKFWLLVLCMDQCSVGRSWTFHAKLQMRLLLFTVWDLYHRMWIDIRAGVLAAKGQRFLLFANNACNACFGPWKTHENFDTKKAWFSAWLSSSCASKCILVSMKSSLNERLASRALVIFGSLIAEFMFGKVSCAVFCRQAFLCPASNFPRP